MGQVGQRRRPGPPPITARQACVAFTPVSIGAPGVAGSEAAKDGAAPDVGRVLEAVQRLDIASSSSALRIHPALQKSTRVGGPDLARSARWRAKLKWPDPGRAPARPMRATALHRIAGRRELGNRQAPSQPHRRRRCRARVHARAESELIGNDGRTTDDAASRDWRRAGDRPRARPDPRRTDRELEPKPRGPGRASSAVNANVGLVRASTPPGRRSR